MTLGELIRLLESADQDYVAPLGFGEGDSYRGDYAQVAFAPAKNVTVREMLGHAKAILGTTMQGYKGGEYEANEYVDCYIDNYGESGGDRIGPVLIAYLTGAAGRNEP